MESETLMLDGIPIVELAVLPIYPDAGETARAIVRHGLADILAWLGEDVGPEPQEPIHLLEVDNDVLGRRLLVSPALGRAIRRQYAEAMLVAELNAFPTRVMAGMPLDDDDPPYWK